MQAYEGVIDIFKRYWVAYGGLRELTRSPYLHVALVLLAITFNTWVAPVCGQEGSCAAWWDQSLSVLPNLLGFTLGGFAIFTGMGDERFRALLASPGKNTNEPTIYVEVCSTFVHFILLQVLALLCAVVAKSWWFYAPWMDGIRSWLPWLNAIGGFLGYGFFLYAITSVMAATMQVFRITNWYAWHQAAQAKKQQQVNPCVDVAPGRDGSEN